MPEEIDGELRAASDSLSARLHPRRPRTGVATQRVSSGQHVKVDGDAGTVTLDGSGTVDGTGSTLHGVVEV